MITSKIEYCAKSFNVPELSTLNLYSGMTYENKMYQRKDRIRSSIFSRIFNLSDNQSQDEDNETITEENILGEATQPLTQSTSLRTQNSNKIEINSYMHDDSISDIEIPLRRQSRLYTPYHENPSPVPYGMANSRSSNQQIHGDYTNSQLTRSVSWNPQKLQDQHQDQPLPLPRNRPITMINHQDTRSNESVNKVIPDRRASRNYANDPEAQARLNHLLSTERRFFIRRTSMIDRKPPPL